MAVKATRLYTGPDGESHFEDIEIPLKDERGVSQWSELIKATGIIFVELYGDKQIDWHNAPHRQFVITLEGAREMEIGDGTKRIFKPGDILLAEDTTGRGHVTRRVKNQPHKAIFITLG